MNILEKIRTDQLVARRAQDKVNLSILSTLFAEVEKVGKDKKNSVTTDAEAIVVIKKFIANNDECIKLSTDENRKKLLLIENNLLNHYLPLQLTEGKIKEIIAEQQLVGVPAVMNYFKNHYSGLYDGKALSQIAKGI